MGIGGVLMSPFHWGLVVGIFIGCGIGVFLMAMLAVAREDRK